MKKTTASPKYVIIGQGAAGAAAANEIKQLENEAVVTIISNEHEGFYSRIDLPDIISGKRETRDALLQTPAQFQDKGIHCLTGEQVIWISPDDHSVELTAGRRLYYDKLLLATGARPMLPRLPGMEATGVFSLWTIEQAKDILLAAAGAKAAVVIGAGLIGIKTALALHQRGLRVTILEQLDRVLPQQLDEAGAEILATAIRAGGVELLTSTRMEAVETSGGRVTGVRAGTRLIACDIVVCAIGVRPDMELARTAGLSLGAGIVTDQFLQTSQADIYAAGDAAEVIDVFGQQTMSAGWPAAVEQGIIAARNMAGVQMRYPGYLTQNSVEIAGIPLVSAGTIYARDGEEILSRQDGNTYRKLVLTNNRLKGFLLMGDIRQAGVLAGVLTRQQPIVPGNSFHYAKLLEL
ncbi:FAD-dependent oxidoreductase [Anaerospora sp.]|uniref:NAD(P)/FAD-dependent oxidoreductase n=1 Tax=Anaerospora sp. TaxID=1960278 RepID=UPI00289B3F3C|nr:FAD-dependent oxidoreductase [Anaerospora sp.]